MDYNLNRGERRLVKLEGEGNKMLSYRIEVEDDPMNPRIGWDNFGTMLCFHKRYTLGDETELKANSFNDWEEVSRYLRDTLKAIIILPLYLIDHSGISISVGSFNDSWDSGQVGFIYITRDKMLEEFEWKNLTAKRREQIVLLLEGEVETYNSYLTGMVYGFVIEDNDGEVIDSCWGFYEESDCKSEAQKSMEFYEERREAHYDPK